MYGMFASMWLTKISYVCKPHKTIPFIFVRATAMRVAGDKEGNGKGGKGKGNGNKIVRQGTVMATKMAIFDSNKGGGQGREQGGQG
jgi:hypothetical protein